MKIHLQQSLFNNQYTETGAKHRYRLVVSRSVPQMGKISIVNGERADIFMSSWLFGLFFLMI